MRNRLASKLGLVCLVAVLSSGATSQGATWADRLFQETGHDFGAVPRGSKVHHEFALTNNQNEALTILDVHASCGCTTGRALSKVVNPGETVMIEAVMDTRNFVGKKATVLFVSVVGASGKQAEARLNVSSTILSDIVLNPGTIDFGMVSRGQTPTLTVALDRINAPTWRIQRMLSSCKAIDAVCDETKRDGRTVSYLLKVTLKADAPIGSIRDAIRLTTNDRETPAFTIPLTATLRGDLSASPGVASLGKVGPGMKAEGKYLLRASKPFKVSSIEGVGDGFQLTTDNDESRPVHLLSLNFKDDNPKTLGHMSRSFKVTTDLPGEGPLDLSATLQIAP